MTMQRWDIVRASDVADRIRRGFNPVKDFSKYDLQLMAELVEHLEKQLDTAGSKG